MTDNRIAFLDHASFLRLRATGVDTVGQVTWIYDRAVDMEGLHRFNRNLGRGWLGRRIERSPLPFGRPRWVAYHDALDIDVAASPRSRAEIMGWLDERAQIRVDPEYGPCWHLGVLPLDDGGTVVTLITSHSVVDGVALHLAVHEAVNGITRDLGYPPPRSRSRGRALLIDTWDAVRGLPEVFRALIACITLVLKRDSATAQPNTSPAAPNRSNESIVVPALTFSCDLASWDARVLELGGSSNSLFVAFATRLAQLMGRLSPADGAVTITMPVNERTEGDFRANALTAITFRVDPDHVVTDLQLIRNEMKQSLAALHDTPNELLEPLPLVPYTPRRLARKMAALALGSSDLPVCCSNVSNLSQDLNRIDGSDADYFSARLFNQGATKQNIERENGQLYLFCGRLNEHVFISVSSYQLGVENSNRYLRELIEQTLADYRLTAEVFG